MTSNTTQPCTENKNDPTTPHLPTDSESCYYEMENQDDSLDSESSTFTFNKHSDRLLAGFRYLRDRSQLFDVTLVAEGQEFPAHRVVLASCSDYFRAMFTNGLKESSQRTIHLHGVCAAALGQLIHFAYTSQITITKDNVFSVLSSASHVQMLSVVEACRRYLCQHVTLDNCTQLDRLAHLYCLDSVRQRAHCFMCEHWTLFSMTAQFLALGVDQLCGILKSDFPVYCAEVDVLGRLFAWINHDRPQRMAHLPKILSLVRSDCLREKDVNRLFHFYPEILESATMSDFLWRVSEGRGGEMEGVVNGRGYFETVLVVGGFSTEPNHQSSQNNAVCPNPRNIVRNLNPQPAQTPRNNTISFLDPETKAFNKLATIPGMNQAEFGLAVMDNHIYVVGGSIKYQDFEESTHPYGFCFNTMTDSWTTLPPMNQERCRFYLGSLHGRLYAVGGEVGNSEVLSECEVLDKDSNAWRPVSPLPVPRRDLAGVSLGGKLFVSGGTDDHLMESSDMWCYDPEEDLWTECEAMNYPRADHSMFAFEGDIYVIGGWNRFGRPQGRFGSTYNPLTSVERYNVDTDSWEIVQQLQPRRFCSFSLLGGQIYVIGGLLGIDQKAPKAEKLDVLDLKSMEWLPCRVSLPEVWEHSTVSVHLPRKVLLAT